MLFTFILSIIFKTIWQTYTKIIGSYSWYQRECKLRKTCCQSGKGPIGRTKFSPSTTQTNTKLILQNTVSAWVLIPPENHNPDKKQSKSSDNSNILHIFNENTYTDFIKAYKPVLIPSYVNTKILQNWTLIDWLFG